MELKLDSCVIRHWRPDDLAELVLLANDWDIARNMRDRFPHPYKVEDGKAWIEIATTEPITNFAIEVEGKLAGGTGLMPFEARQRKAVTKDGQILDHLVYALVK